MRALDQSELDALAVEVASGSHGDHIQASLTRGEETREVDLNAWTASWDAGRQDQAQLTVELADPDGTLAPWGMGDICAPGGTLLSLTWVSGTSGLTVPWGDWLLSETEPDQMFRIASGGPMRLIPGGGTVTVWAGENPTRGAFVQRLDSEAPNTRITILAEVTRLMQQAGIGVTVHPAVQDRDRAMPRGHVYETVDRLSEIENLLDRLDATYRSAYDGTLEIIPAEGLGPVWTVAGGDGGALVNYRHRLSDDGIHNVAVSNSETADGRQLIGRSTITSGPLSINGAFGYRPIFHRAIATTQNGVQRDAETLLANRLHTGEIAVPVSCLFHPAVQIHDLVELVPATSAGEMPLIGRVLAITARSIQGAGCTPAKSMSMTVAVPVDTFERIAGRIRREDGVS